MLFRKGHDASELRATAISELRMTRTIGFLLYDDVELLDFAGPFEVFLTACRLVERDQPSEPALFELCTFAKQASVRFRGGMLAQVNETFGSSRCVDLLVVPGGVVNQAMNCHETLAWLRDAAARAERVFSICTGAFLLARAGLLTGRRATTHWEDLEDLRSLAPEADVVEGVRWVEDDRLLCAAGISAGIDAALHCLATLTNLDFSLRTARQMEYVWNR